MKLLFVWILLIGVVYSYMDKTFSPIYIVKYPSIIPYKGTGYIIHLQIDVTKDLDISTLSPGSHLKLFLLPPPVLELEEELSTLTPLDEWTIGRAPERSGIHSDDSYEPEPVDFGTCKLADAEKVIGKLTVEMQKTMAHMFGKHMKAVSSLLSLKGKNVNEITITKYSKKLGKGSYKWSGKFKIRDDYKVETGINEIFDDFVLAIGNHQMSPKNEDKYCLTHSQTAASVMLKHLTDSNVSLIHCISMALSKSDRNYSLNAIKPLFTVTFKHSHSYIWLSMDFNILFEGKLEDLGKNYIYFVFDLPKEINQLTLFKKGCRSDLIPSTAVDSCSYDQAKSQMQVRILKKNVKSKVPINLSFDIKNSINKPYSFAKDLDYYLSVYSDYVEEPSKTEFSQVQRMLNVSKVEHPTCIEPLGKLYKNMTKALENRKIFISKVAARPDFKKNLLYYYSLTRRGNNYLMRIFLKNNSSFVNTVKLVLTATDGSRYLIKETDSFDIFGNDYLPYNTGVVFTHDGAKITLNFGSKQVGRDDDYFEVPLVFKSDGGVDKLSNPNLFRVTLENDAGLKLLDGLIEGHSDNLKTGQGTTTVKDTTIITDTYYRGKKTLVIYAKITTLAIKKVGIYFSLENPEYITSFSHSITGDYEYKETSDSLGATFYKIEVEPTKVDGSKINSIIELEINPKNDYQSISIDSLTINVLREPTMQVTIEPEKVLATRVINFSPEDFQHFKSYGLPCLAKDTKLTSSRFREYENANYILTRVVDCERPWLPFTNFTGAELDVSVDHSKDEFNHITTKEIISFNDKTKSKLVQALVANRVFYEHSLYLLFDKTAVDVIRNQMISANECMSGDATCPSYKHIPVLTKFVTSLFESEDLTFSNVVVGYYDSKKLEVYLARENKKKIDFSKPTVIADLETAKSAFESLVDLASANANAHKMGSSFSVLGVLDKTVSSTITKNMTEYKIPTDPKSLNGTSPVPIYVEIIPVDSKYIYQVGSDICDVYKTMNVTDVDIIDQDHIKKIMKKNEIKQHVFINYKFQNDVKEQKNIISRGKEEPSLKGSSSENLSFKREDFSLFIRVKDPMISACAMTVKKEVPIRREMKKSMNYMKVIPKAYHVFATCSSFKSDEFSKKQTKYVLSFRGVKIGEYLVTPNKDVSEKLYSECDMFSLYKHMPTTPYFTATTKHVPTILSTIKSNKVDKFTQVIESESV